MRIQLQDGKYTPSNGMAEKPIIMLSYIDAAEYCNYLSGGPVYRVIDEQVTARDTIAVDSPRVYYIPTRSEWLKGLFFRNGVWEKYRPLPQAEMVEDLARTWYRAAVGKGKSPEEIIVINNYTTNNGGLSEDNIRKADVTLRLAATPAFSVEKKLDKPSNLQRTVFVHCHPVSSRFLQIPASKSNPILGETDYRCILHDGASLLFLASVIYSYGQVGSTLFYFSKSLLGQECNNIYFFS